VKILVYGINYAPELTGIGKFSGEMATWLAAQGHSIRVVTAPPYYPDWRVFKGYSSFLYLRHQVESVDVWRCPVWVPAVPSGLKRIVHLLSFALSSSFVMFRQVFWRPDLVIVIEPPLFCSPVAVFIARICGARSWLHIQDLEVDAAFDLGVLSSPGLKKIVLMIERWLMGRFDRVSTISEQMLSRLAAKGVLAEKQILFPNWVDIERICPIICPYAFRKQMSISEDSIVFLYSGNMGEKQGLEIVVEAARRLVDRKDIVFVMCGQGAAYSRLRNLAAGLENVHWLPLQPLDRLNDLLNLADVHLLPQRADAADLVMPSKLTGMLASGRPVLATALDGTQIAQVLESSGVVVPPENVGLFVNAILDLSENPEKRQKLGKNAREYAVEYLGRDAVLERFEESLQECLSAKN